MWTSQRQTRKLCLLRQSFLSFLHLWSCDHNDKGPRSTLRSVARTDASHGATSLSFIDGATKKGDALALSPLSRSRTLVLSSSPPLSSLIFAELRRVPVEFVAPAEASWREPATSTGRARDIKAGRGGWKKQYPDVPNAALRRGYPRHKLGRNLDDLEAFLSSLRSVVSVSIRRDVVEAECSCIDAVH